MQDDPVTLMAAAAMGSMQIALLLAAVAGLTIVMMSTRRRAGQARGNPGSGPRERFAQLSKEAGVTRDMEQVMAELDSLSRQIHGRIDTKLARLEKLIRDADQRIAALSGPRSADKPNRSPGLEVTLDAVGPEVSAPRKAVAADRRDEAVFALADEGRPILEIAQRSGRTPGEIELMLALRRTRREPPAPDPAGSSSATSRPAR